MEYLNSLKNLYGLNEGQMDELKKTVKLNILPTNIDDVIRIRTGEKGKDAI